jgi:transposase
MNRTTLQMKAGTTTPSLYLSMELSEKSWGLLFSDGESLSAHTVEVGDVAGVLAHAKNCAKRFGLARTAQLVSCQEAGRDGFWIHRALEAAGARSLVVDATSIEVDRRMRRAKTDRLDAERLMRLLIRYCAGETQALRVVRVPSEEVEDARRDGRERERLVHERTGHVCRIKALLVLHGVRGAELDHLDEVVCASGKSLPPRLLRELQREYQRLQLINEQLKDIEKERKALLEKPSRLTQCITMLMQLRGIGPQAAWLFSEEFFGWRDFQNRRQVGAAAGLVSMPFNSGHGERDQGISKAGNKRVRTMAVQLAWGWLRWQPDTAIAKWFRKKFETTKRSKRVGIVAVARKLLIVLWRMLKTGEVPEGAVMAH